MLKGLGHAILGNFSTVQMDVELIKLLQWRLKTVEELKQNTGKPRGDMAGSEINWRGLKWIVLSKFEKSRPPFFKFNPVYIEMSF